MQPHSYKTFTRLALEVELTCSKLSSSFKSISEGLLPLLCCASSGAAPAGRLRPDSPSAVLCRCCDAIYQFDAYYMLRLELEVTGERTVDYGSETSASHYYVSGIHCTSHAMTSLLGILGHSENLSIKLSDEQRPYRAAEGL